MLSQHCGFQFGECLVIFGQDMVNSKPRFYSCKTLSPVAVRAPFTPEQQEATIEGSIPAEWHFSDHVPLGGVFQLSAEEGEKIETVVI